MPISLPPISRRRFLQTAVAGAGAIALGSRFAFSDETKSVDPSRIALLSDTHIAPNRDYVHKTGIRVWDQYQQATREILALSPKPAALLVNGDCALDHGTTEAYVTFVDGLTQVRAAGIPVHATLGNHDERVEFAKAIPTDDARVKEITDHTVSIVRLPHLDWYMLDSLRKTKETPGELGAAQLAWLAKSLDTHADRPTVVMFHHQPDPHPADGKIKGLVDAPAFLKVVQPRKQVKAVLFGHTHQWARYELEGLHLVNLPTSAYVFQAGQPAGWVDAQTSENGMKLQLHAITPNHPKDKEVLDLKWRDNA